MVELIQESSAAFIYLPWGSSAVLADVSPSHQWREQGRSNLSMHPSNPALHPHTSLKGRSVILSGPPPPLQTQHNTPPKKCPVQMRKWMLQSKLEFAESGTLLWSLTHDITSSCTKSVRLHLCIFCHGFFFSITCEKNVFSTQHCLYDQQETETIMVLLPSTLTQKPAWLMECRRRGRTRGGDQKLWARWQVWTRTFLIKSRSLHQYSFSLHQTIDKCDVSVCCFTVSRKKIEN